MAAPTRQELITTTRELLALAKQGDYPALAARMAYHGSGDPVNDYRKPFDYKHDYDQKMVDAWGGRLAKLQDDIDGIEFGEQFSSEEDEGTWHAIEVFFKMGPDQRHRYFGYLELGGKLLLGDVDQ